MHQYLCLEPGLVHMCKSLCVACEAQMLWTSWRYERNANEPAQYVHPDSAALKNLYGSWQDDWLEKL